ncbi:MAG: hypothetical protein AB8F95_09035 [Bacteroidia bacterium]
MKHLLTSLTFLLIVIIGTSAGYAQCSECPLVLGQDILDSTLTSSVCDPDEENVFNENFQLTCILTNPTAPDTIDPNGCYRLTWDFGNGNIGCGLNPDFGFTGGGDYMVNLSIDKIYPVKDKDNCPVQDKSCGEITDADFANECYASTNFGSYSSSYNFPSEDPGPYFEDQCLMPESACITISLLEHPSVNEPFRVMIQLAKDIVRERCKDDRVNICIDFLYRSDLFSYENATLYDSNSPPNTIQPAIHQTSPISNLPYGIARFCFDLNSSTPEYRLMLDMFTNDIPSHAGESFKFHTYVPITQSVPLGSVLNFEELGIDLNSLVCCNDSYTSTRDVGPKDPNMKFLVEGKEEQIPPGIATKLNYQIHFYNKGNGNTCSVTVKDTLSEKLNICTFVMDSLRVGTTTYRPGINTTFRGCEPDIDDTQRILTWTFNDPDVHCNPTSRNIKNSGVVAGGTQEGVIGGMNDPSISMDMWFSISTHCNVNKDDQILNRAGVRFDSLEWFVTDYAETNVVCCDTAFPTTIDTSFIDLRAIVNAKNPGFGDIASARLNFTTKNEITPIFGATNTISINQGTTGFLNLEGTVTSTNSISTSISEMLCFRNSTLGTNFPCTVPTPCNEASCRRCSKHCFSISCCWRKYWWIFLPIVFILGFVAYRRLRKPIPG